MSTHILRLGRRGVVHVAADVEIEVVRRASDPPPTGRGVRSRGTSSLPLERGGDLFDDARGGGSSVHDRRNIRRPH